jgi:transcriptional regulator with XRE-family HTH domain
MDRAEESELAGLIAKCVSKRRMAKGLTQEEVAELLGIGQEAVSRIERGVTMPTISRLVELSEVLECGVDELLIEGSNRPADQANYLSRILKKLSDADRKLVVEIVEKFSARLAKK